MREYKKIKVGGLIRWQGLASQAQGNEKGEQRISDGFRRCTPVQSQPRPVRASTEFLNRCVVILVSLVLFSETAVVSASSSGLSSPHILQSLSQTSNLQTEAIELKPGEIVKRKIKGNEADAFSLRLAAGQYARLEITWRGADLVASVTKPDAKQLFEFDTQVNGPRATSLSMIADEAGLYKLKVQLVETQSVNGSYELKLEDVRSPSPSDENRLAAEKSMVEAQHQKLKEAAVSKYEEAIQLWREVKDAEGEANALRGLANLYKTGGNLEKAEKSYNAAIALWQQSGDRQSEAYLLIDLGLARQSLASAESALGVYNEALLKFQNIKDSRGEALASYSLGLANARLGKLSEALKFYEAALKIYQAEGDSFLEARTLNNMGGAYGVLGEHDKALELYGKAVTLLRELKDQYREGILINNIGQIYNDLGDWQKAKENYEQALSIYKSLLKREDWTVCGESLSEQNASVCNAAASSLDNVGELYNTLGDSRAALELFKESLPIRRSLKQPRGIGSTLSRICYATYLEGMHRDALDLCRQALPYNQAAGDYREAATYTVMGMIHSALNEPEKALEYYGNALRLEEKAGDRRAQALTLDKMGGSYGLTGNSVEKFKSYERALQLWREVKDRDGEALTLYNVARAERERGNLMEAHRLIGEAIGLVESLRVNLNSQRLRTAYFSTKVNFYELDIDLKMEMARTESKGDLVAQALQVNERARARSLLDILAEAHIEVRPNAVPELKRMLEHKVSLQRKLNDKADALTKLLSGKNQKEQAAAMAAEIDRLSLEYDENEARIKMRSPRYATLTKPQALSLKEIQERLLDDRTLLLEYSLGEQRSYLWVVSSTEIKWYVLPERAKIEESARRFKQTMTASQKLAGETAQHYQSRLLEAEAQYRQEAGELGRMLLGQAAAELKDRRLLIVAEGELQSISFAALSDPIPPDQNQKPDSQQPASSSEPLPLVARHEIIGLPSATTLAMIRSDERPRAASKSVAVLADPVFEKDDPRLMTAKLSRAPDQTARSRSQLFEQVLRDYGSGLPRLFASRQEANDIMTLVPAGTGLEALDFKANRATAIDPALGRYRVVHFATHSLFNDEYPELSGIVLSLYNEHGRPQEDGFLRLQDIYNLKLPVDLVVLSACRTGLGKNVRGEGLIGLTRGFMYAGAARVVASLWKVDDEATAELMKRFYQYIFKGGMSPAASLQAAQMSLRAQRRWHMPYFWAGFILQGEWK
jgi:CHAT domain-containing protein/tetratricopeptide (TPR) repeat protein